MASVYTSYYMNQCGGGEIGRLYVPDFLGVQRGSGLGSIFGGLIRFLKPLFMKGLSALGTQAVKTGTEILSDIGTKPIKDILITRGLQAKQEIQNKLKNKFHKMTGEGIYTRSQEKRASPLISSEPTGCKKSFLHKIKPLIRKKKRKLKKVKATKERHLDIFS